MKSRRVPLWLWAALVGALAYLAACGSNGNEDRASTPAAAAKVEVGDRWRSLSFDGRERRYLVHIPPSYDGRAPVPLVIVLHGGGGNAESAVRMTAFSDKADKEEFIVVYPNGTGRLVDRLLTWNSGNCCGYALDQHVDDVGFVRALIREVEGTYRIDERRIFATGMSNGGMMSYRLACELADLIAAIGPVAGALNVESCAPSMPVSVVAFHGTADEHVLYEGGEPRKRADSHPRIDRSVAYAMDFWARRNGCSSSSQRQTTGSITVETYTDCRAGTGVTLYAVKGGGHAWPGGQRGTAAGDPPTRELSATDAMWDFFARHPKP